MRVLIAADKFKGSLTAYEVCLAIEAGLKEKYPDIDCLTFPLADGGEGTMDILTRRTRGHFVDVTVHDPLLRKIESSYGISSEGQYAFIEMSAASGLHLLKPGEKDVMRTSTRGTGELILDAMEIGVAQIFLGIGGSATNDGGTGAAQVLGYEFLDENENAIQPVGGNLHTIRSIRTLNVHPWLSEVKFTAVCDVENPLTGNRGAAFVYAAQKGATPDQVVILDEGLKNLAKVIDSQFGISINDIPGAGAGGGFGGGVVAFFNGSLRRGVDVVFDFTGFEEEVKNADVIITGEGKVDQQTLQGKVVSGVARLGKRYGKKVICVTGKNELSVDELIELGIMEVFSLTELDQTMDTFKNTAELLGRIPFVLSN
jgi:glycerate kinase